MTIDNPSARGGRREVPGTGPDQAARLAPAVVMLVRQRIATGFYDSPPVRRAIAEAVVDREVGGTADRRPDGI